MGVLGWWVVAVILGTAVGGAALDWARDVWRDARWLRSQLGGPEAEALAALRRVSTRRESHTGRPSPRPASGVGLRAGRGSEQAPTRFSHVGDGPQPARFPTAPRSAP